MSDKRRTSADRIARQTRQHGYQPRFEMLEARNLLSITSVVGRHIFYENSKLDGNTAGVSASDDGAIATDKSAYLPGSGQSTFSNITSYTKGINGIMVDIAGPHGTLSAADFTFKVSSTAGNNTPSTWTPAPAPTTVSVRTGAGVSGSDRVEIIWANGAILNRWLEVIVEGNDAAGGNNTNTGLAASNIFFFGNRVGESSSTPAGLAITNSTDEIGARNNAGAGATITNLFDFDRSGIVNTTDSIAARNNAGTLLKIQIGSPPALVAALVEDTGPDGLPNGDGVTQDPTIDGTLTAANGLSSFTFKVNGGSTVDAMPYLSGSTFLIDESGLQASLGGPLADGPYLVHLEALDAQGLTAVRNLNFTLKRSIAAPSLPDLVTADDAGTSAVDNITNDATPRIDVSAENGSLVRLYVDDVLVDEGTGAPGLQFTLDALSDGVHEIHVVAQDGAGNSATSPTLSITINTVAPTVSATTLVTLSDDLTPHVTVSASDPDGLANGTQVVLDVDLNYDGDFDDPGELARTLSTLHDGQSYFESQPALPTDDGGEPYYVQLRVRVSDVAGNVGASTPQSLKIDTIGNTVLDDYVTPDPTPTYTHTNTFTQTGYKAYVLDLTSQTWRSVADHSKPVWKHWVQVIVPTGPITNTALLFITGGSTGGAPGSPDASLATMAMQLKSVVVRLPTVPNQPITFTGDPGNPRSEDAIIAYTFEQYINNFGDPGNESWPALLPMVQSAVAAMDAAQHFLPTVEPGKQIDDFIVTGYSKRGWTTWLTAAVDDRVRAIVPGVIDLLNIDEQMLHHYGFYNGWSPALNDYTAYQQPQESFTFGGQEIGRVVDPYMYLDNGRFDDMPKLMINSSGDEFFVPDSAQFYFNDLPGTDNYLRYVPNTGHGLNGTDPANSTITFFDSVVNNRPLPEFSWTVGQDGSIAVQTSTTPAVNGVVLWQATNAAARDFRRSFTPGVNWTSSVLPNLGGGNYLGNVATPATGARAYFVQLTFPHPVPGFPSYVFTTEIRVKSNIPAAAWPFFMPTNPPPGGEFAGPLAVGDDTGAPNDLSAVAGRSAPASSSAQDTITRRAAVRLGSDSAHAARVAEALASLWQWDFDDESESLVAKDDDLSLVLMDEDWFAE